MQLKVKGVNYNQSILINQFSITQVKLQIFSLGLFFGISNLLIEKMIFQNNDNHFELAFQYTLNHLNSISREKVTRKILKPIQFSKSQVVREPNLCIPPNWNCARAMNWLMRERTIKYHLIANFPFFIQTPLPLISHPYNKIYAIQQPLDWRTNLECGLNQDHQELEESKFRVEKQ